MISAEYFKKLDCIEDWNKNQLTSRKNIPSPIYCGDSSQKMASIMINVAWGNEYLLELLKILHKNDVKSTFFLDGSWTHKYPLLAKNILSDGHEVGSHAYSHPDMRGLTLERIKWQLQKTNEIIQTTLEVKPQFFTPPSGEFDERVVDLAAKEGMLTVLSTIDTLDWQNPEVKDLVAKIQSNLKNGSIILIHPTKSSVAALPEMIKVIKENNYTLGTLTDLLAATPLLYQINLENIEQATIYVNGEPITIDTISKDNDLLVPAYFFKYAGLDVEFNSRSSKITLATGDRSEELPCNTYFPYLSLYEVTTLFDINLLYDKETLRLYLVTPISSEFKPQIISKGNPLANQVALTFDDGPDNYNTPKILDILRDKGVKATFFVLGEQAAIFPDILKRIVKEGHSIGNHTWSHCHLAHISTKQVLQEIQLTQEIIQSLVGITPTLFRPPYGFLTDSDFHHIDNLSLKIISWNVDTVDYLGVSANHILETVKREISPGSIILQHCFQDSTGILSGSVEALPLIIDTLQAEGMKFVTLETLVD